MYLAPKHLIICTLLAPIGATAQTRPNLPKPAPQPVATSLSSPAPQRPHYWRNLAAGFVSSILAHEAGHVIASYAVGNTPRFGFDKWRPTVYSGIDAESEPHKQFIFSSAGLTVQALLDEVILDIPHKNRGNAFERGLLIGGITTAFFYATLGRNASNSDISFMANTSSLNKTQASLIFVGIAALHTVRITRNDHYANFFIRPNNTQGLAIGISIQPTTASTSSPQRRQQPPTRRQGARIKAD